MDLRLRNLEHLDGRAVPLPHGTEVVTRVARIVGERRVPQGAVGRVTKADGDTLDVTVLGVGVVRYACGELSPHRIRAGPLRAPARGRVGGPPSYAPRSTANAER
jgi:hypothetical protein